MTATSLTPGHRQALAEMRRIEAASAGTVSVEWPVGKPDSHGWLSIEVKLDCADTAVKNGGVQLKTQEHVTIGIPPDFPFQGPNTFSHNKDLATQQHVQWGGYICLYQTSADWDPSDGMMGYIDRLAEWFLRAASGTLDAPGEPIDPPVAYILEEGAGCVVIDPDMPAECTRAAAQGLPWQGAAILYQAGDDRVDVLGWISASQGVYRDTEHLQDTLTRFEETFGQQVFLAPVIVLPGPMSFEFPLTVGALAIALVAQRIALEDFVGLIGRAAWINQTRARPAGRDAGASGTSPGAAKDVGAGAASALYVFVGSPMRGTAGTVERLIHLAAWRLSGDEAGRIARLVRLWDAKDPAFTGPTREAIAEVEEWITEAEISWAAVYERRPQIVMRRDDRRPAGWLREDGGRVVLVLGCGALGAPIAEYCLRAGARKLILVDDKRVTPGVLVRQPYEDADIGRPKATTLAHRLEYIGFRAEIVPHVGNAMDIIAANGAAPEADLIIDATANQTVAAMIELKRWTSGATWPPILTVGIGHHAERGFGALALPNATGAGVDLMRKLALAAHAEPGLSDVARDFFPEQPRTRSFVPEPGCSAATFRGSAPEVQALAAYLFAGALSDLRRTQEAEHVTALSARVVRLASTADQDGSDGTAELTWSADITIDDTSDKGDGPGYQIRISETALADMRDEAHRVRDKVGPAVETGGTLFGQIDDAAHIAWVTVATGPAPNSNLSQAEYIHGTEGVSELRNMLHKHSAGRLRFVGMWHTHPGGPASPSQQDEHAMHDAVGPAEEVPPRSVLLILGGQDGQWNDWLNCSGPPQIFARLIDRVS